MKNKEMLHKDMGLFLMATCKVKDGFNNSDAYLGRHAKRLLKATRELELLALELSNDQTSS